MSTAKYIGDPSLAVRVRTERDPVRGIRQAAVYQFATELEASTFIGTLALNQQWVKEPEPPGWQVTVYTPDIPEGEGDPDQNDVYELFSNHIEKDLYEHPRSKLIHENNITALRKFMKSPVEDATPAFTDATTLDEALKLWRLIHKGSTKFAQDEYVFRYTVTVSSRAALNASFSNVGKLLTNSEVVGALPGGALPTGIGFAISDIPTPASIPTDYVWRWLKKAPIVRQSLPGKITITQEFWLDLWSTYIYELAV
jgi:hypothetical protein